MRQSTQLVPHFTPAHASQQQTSHPSFFQINSAILDQFKAALTQNSLLDQSTVNFVNAELQKMIALAVKRTAVC